jgi:hypothetical protein
MLAVASVASAGDANDVVITCTRLETAATGSDNWPVTWHSNDHQYTSWGDGQGFSSGCSSDIGIARIEGDYPGHTFGNVLGCKGPSSCGDGCEDTCSASCLAENAVTFRGKSYGLLSLDHDGDATTSLFLWNWVDTQYRRDSQLYESTDNGATWAAVSGVEFNDTGTPNDFNNPVFVQYGQAYGLNEDGYVYIYSPKAYDSGTEGAFYNSDAVYLARVAKANIKTKASYEYFSGTPGTPSWSSTYADRKPVFWYGDDGDNVYEHGTDADDDKIHWVMSVNYHPTLDRYFLFNNDVENATQASTGEGDLDIWQSANPWGPWTLLKSYDNFCSSTLDATYVFSYFTLPAWDRSDGTFFVAISGTGGNDEWNLLSGTYQTNGTGTTYYVRTDGNDTNCSGLSDAAYPGSGSGQPCAFATISKGETTAVCGDTVHVRAGEFFEASTITISDSCSSGSQKKIIGAGSGTGAGATRLFLGLSTAMTCSADGTYTYACTIPASGLKDSATRDGRVGVCQTFGTNTVDLEPKTDRKYTADTFMCLTPTSSETGAVDYNDDGTGESNLDSTNARGFWYAGASDSEYIINPWGGMAPSSSVRFFAPTSTNASISVTGTYITLQGLTIYSGQTTAISVTNSGDNFTGTDITVYGGKIASGDNSSFTGLTGATWGNIELYNHTRRIKDKGCGELGNGCDSSSNDFMSNTAFNSYGDGTTVTNIRAIGGQEGWSANGANLVLKNFHFSSFTNHGFRMDNKLETALIENGISYNNQESMFVANCFKDVEMRHVTLPYGPTINGWPGPSQSFSQSCTNTAEEGTWRFEVYNSIIGDWTFNGAYLAYTGAEEVRGNDVEDGDCVSKAWVFDYNAYPWAEASSSAFVKDRYYPYGLDAKDKNFTTIAAWRAHAPPDDGCCDCINDPNGSVASNTALTNVYVNPSNVDLSSNQADYRLKSGAFPIGIGSPTYINSSGLDLDGNPRNGTTPSPGAYEYGSTAVGGRVHRTGKVGGGTVR